MPSAPGLTINFDGRLVSLAGWWRRAGGQIIDTLIIGVPLFIVGLAVGLTSIGNGSTGFSVSSSSTVSSVSDVSTAARMALLIVALAVYFTYAVTLLKLRGQTVGMMAVKIKAVDKSSGNALSMRQVWLRVLTVYFLISVWSDIGEIAAISQHLNRATGGAALWPLIGFVGGLTTYLWPLGSRFRQTLQDKAAQSVVVLA
jgi:uncharacterized RDD family membrane protein YckC